MSLLRHAIGRLFGGLLVLGLAALFLNALIQSQQHWSDSAAALHGPRPPAIPLSRLPADAPRTEAHVIVRIDAALDLAVPGGTARLYLLADPSDRFDAPARGAVFVSPADLSAFEQLVADNTQTTVNGAPILALNGALGVPYWIDRAEQAAVEADRALAAGLVYLSPFLHGRAEGLAPPLLSYLVPSFLFVLLAAVLVAELRRLVRRRQVLTARRGLDALDREVEEAAALAISLQPGDPAWIDLTSRRQHLRRKRSALDAQLARANRAGYGRWLWLLALAAGGVASVVPHRPLMDAVATHLLGGTLAGTGGDVAAAVDGRWDALLALPGELAAQALLAVMGPQSIGAAEQVRAMPFTLWLAMLTLFLFAFLRRGGQSDRAH